MLSIKQLVFFITCALSSATAVAEVNFNVGKGVEVLAINGNEIDENVNQSSFQMQNGLQQVLVRYNVEIKTGFNEYELERSEMFVLLFDAADQNVTLSGPKVSSEAALSEFNKNAGFSLIDGAGAAVNYRSNVLKVPGFQFNIDYERELKRLNTTDVAASLKLTSKNADLAKNSHYENAAIPSATSLLNNADRQAVNRNDISEVGFNKASANKGAVFVNDSTSGTAEVSGHAPVVAVDMLKYWYQQATEQQRQAFKKWMMQQ